MQRVEVTRPRWPDATKPVVGFGRHAPGDGFCGLLFGR